MKIYLCEDYAAMSRKAAHLLAAQIRLKPDSVLGLATGSTPISAYRQLIEWYEQGDVDFSQVCSINLDEYAGLSPQHDQSYRWFMQHHLFDHVNIDPARTHLPNGLADDPEAECRRYDEVIATHGPVDLQVLGMGHNGHIGFNEPDDHFPLHTHVVELAPSTIEANARFFSSADEVPRRALTMGIGAIMKARKVLVVVSGADKADIVRAAFAGPITPRVPASILQLHPDVTLVGDQAALSGLNA